MTFSAGTALERVAQNNPGQRQTVVNVLCAYLRMHYTPPVAAAPSLSGPVPGLPVRRSVLAASRDPQQELQVRLTAQRILTIHLTLPAETDSRTAGTMAASAQQPFWPAIDLDLTGAHLVDWDQRNSHVRRGAFTNATFTGDAGFDETTFVGDAEFDRVTFTGDAGFDKVTFTGDAGFFGATFTGAAGFDGVTFINAAEFGGATFTGIAEFGEATFTHEAEFDGVIFVGDAGFGEVTFTGDAGFDRATFTSDARFFETAFAGAARFDGAAFVGDAGFGNATFSSKQPAMFLVRVEPREDRRDVWPSGWLQHENHLVFQRP